MQIEEALEKHAAFLRMCDNDLCVLQEHEEKPEDCIPAEPGNEEARTFLAHAPTKGLWMPLGKEVKVMQCEYSYTVSLIPASVYT